MFRNLYKMSIRVEQFILKQRDHLFEQIKCS